jgi:hypothetical protein
MPASSTTRNPRKGPFAVRDESYSGSATEISFTPYDSGTATGVTIGVRGGRAGRPACGVSEQSHCKTLATPRAFIQPLSSESRGPIPCRSSLPWPPPGISRVTVQFLLHGAAQVAHQMKSVGDLGGLRRAAAHAVGIRPVSIWHSEDFEKAQNTRSPRVPLGTPQKVQHRPRRRTTAPSQLPLQSDMFGSLG